MEISTESGRMPSHNAANAVSEIKQGLETVGAEICVETLSNALNMALQAYHNAYRPYVADIPRRGAVIIERGSDRVFSGTDVQNAAYPSSFLALATAVRSAASAGVREIAAAVIYGDDPIVFGAELDVVHEFASEVPIIQIQRDGAAKIVVHKAPFLSVNSLSAATFPVHRNDMLARGQLLDRDFIQEYSSADLDAVYEWCALSVTKQDYYRAIRAAIEGGAASYSPYSHYPVGNALVLSSGEIVSGCNVESYSMLGMCAERTAIGKAVSAGLLKDTPGTFVEQIALVVNYVPSNFPADPCGGCRQALLEFTNKAPALILCRSEKVTFANGLASGAVYHLDATNRETIECAVPIEGGGFVPSEFSRKNLF